MTEFTDYVFGRNGLNWENHQPFLSTDELTHVWFNWKTKRGITIRPQEKKKKEDSSGEKKKQLASLQRQNLQELGGQGLQVIMGEGTKACG